MIDFAADLQDYMRALELVDGPTSWYSTRGALDDEDDQVVQVSDDGGPAPEVFAAQGMGDEAIEFPAALVGVRAAANERGTARDKAAEIYDALHGLQGATLNGQQYMLIRARSSAFSQIQDAKRRYTFTMSYVAMVAAS